MLFKVGRTGVDTAGMAELMVVRWKRYGKDRLYVNTDDGTRVGWLDLQSGEATVEIDALRADFDAAVADHRPAGARPAPPAAPIPAATAAPERPWTDLALNRPGEGVRAQAFAEKEKAPIRTLAARLLRVHTDERAWRLGADGEEKVGAQLTRLPEPWRAVHSIPIGDRGSDIDHIAIGPGGVFTIHTKHHPDAKVWVRGDTVKVNGHNQYYVRNARFEAKRAASHLGSACGFPVPVTGVIAIVGARGGFKVQAQPADGMVKVVGRKQLSESLARQGSILTGAQVATIYEAARRSTTWLPR